MTLSNLLSSATKRLAPQLGLYEAKATVRIIIETLKGYDPVQVLMHGDDEISDFIKRKISNVVDRVLAGEPVQYVLSTARWYGMDFKVTPDVLIPRPETQGLVDLIVNEWAGKPDLKVLDLGTGSGAIAIALSRNLTFPNVTAVDISPKALDIAKENANALKAKIKTVVWDIFKLGDSGRALPTRWDIIVSNPPYVLDSERLGMDARVTEHEPSLALFVPDADRVRYYEAIARYAKETLSKGAGMLYFEINPLTVKEVVTELDKLKVFTDIHVLRDSFGKERYLSAKRDDY